MGGMDESLFMAYMLIILVTDVIMNFCVAMYARSLRNRFALCLTQLEQISKSLDLKLGKTLESMANQLLSGVKALLKGYYGKAKQNAGNAMGDVQGMVGKVRGMMGDLKELSDGLPGSEKGDGWL